MILIALLYYQMLILLVLDLEIEMRMELKTTSV